MLNDFITINDTQYPLPQGFTVATQTDERGKTHKMLDGSSRRDLTGVSRSVTLKWALATQEQLEQLLDIYKLHQLDGGRALLTLRHACDGWPVLLSAPKYSFKYRGSHNSSVIVTNITMKGEE